MAQAAVRPASSLPSRLKANALEPISGSSQSSRQSSQSRQSSLNESIVHHDTLADPTVNLIRRVLAPLAQGTGHDDDSIEGILPPLTSSNDVDIELYAIVAVVVKDLVQSWYSKITSDQSFVEEVLQILAHCTRGLETRLRTIDLEGLVLDEIPTLIELHIRNFRLSHDSSHALHSSSTPRQIYHSFDPHPALTPVPVTDNSTASSEQATNEADYRQILIQGALAVLLPTEDLENDGLRTFLTDVLAEPILGNAVCGKVCEEWFIWASITTLCRTMEAHLRPELSHSIEPELSRSRLEKFGLLSDVSAVTPDRTEKKRSMVPFSVHQIWHYVLMTAFWLQVLTSGFYNMIYSSPRYGAPAQGASTSEPSNKKLEGSRRQRPLLRFRIFSLISTLIDLQHKMPWFTGLVSLGQHHLTTGSLQALGTTNGILDQYLHSLLQAYAHPSSILPALLRIVRRTLFPNDTLQLDSGSSTVAPSANERLQIKESCAEAILALLPSAVSQRYFGDPALLARDPQDGRAGMVRAVEVTLLDVWSDPWMNKHLAYHIIELVLVRAMPELAEKTPHELMDARLGEGWNANS